VAINHKANPDEKGTERMTELEKLKLEGTDHKANPDEKGTERSVESRVSERVYAIITRPIPTKRELKAEGFSKFLYSNEFMNHKANPDEKGTESCTGSSRNSLQRLHHKANPDEKGTESIIRASKDKE